jgi:hypothetical protein
MAVLNQMKMAAEIQAKIATSTVRATITAAIVWCTLTSFITMTIIKAG